MNEQMSQLIEKLAEKLGTTGEHLWGVLLKQAPISSATNLAGIALGSVALLVAYLFIQKHKDDWDDFDLGMAKLFWFLGALIVAVLLVGNAEIIIAGFTNPEYWALKQIIK